MNKKLITVLITLSLTASLIGCSKQNTVVASNTSTTQTSAVTSEVLSNINVPSGDSESIGEAKTFIELGDKITVTGEGTTVENNKLIITAAGTYSIKGTLIAAGSAGMAQAPSTDSTQNSIKVTLVSQSAGTIVHIESESGEQIATFAPAKQYSSFVIASSKIKTGTTYEVYVGGSSTGTVVNGLYSDGTYTKGKQIGSASISGTVTEITQEGVTVSNRMGGGQRGNKGGMKAPGQ